MLRNTSALRSNWRFNSRIDVEQYHIRSEHVNKFAYAAPTLEKK